MATRFESDKYTPQAGKDGGLDPATYEKGTDLTLAPFMGGMIGWWKFDESGSVVNDSSGFGKNGTMYVSSTPTDNHTSSGCKAGTCANFSGTNYYISILGTNYNVSNGYSMTAWFKPNALGAGSNIFLGSYSVPAYLSFHTAGSALFQSAQISSTQKTLSGVNPVSTGNWYFTAGTFNGSTLTTYLNGSYESSASYPGSGSLGSGICLGGYNCTIGYWTNGSVDDVRIYNRALSAAEIAAIYNATK